MLQFEYPILFILLIPLFISILFFVKNLSNINKERIVIVILRGFTVILLIFAITIPSLMLPINTKQIIYLLDESKSMDGNREQMTEWIRTSLEAKNAEDEFGIVSFSEETFVQQTFQANPSIGVFQEVESNGQTHLENGLLTAASLFDYSAGRIVLLTDGNETIGSSSDILSILKEQGVEIDVMPFSSQEREDMALTQLKVSESMFEGEYANLAVKILSNQAKQANIRISINDRDILNESIQVKQGENVYTFSHLIEDHGLFIYKAEIQAENDFYIENNSLYAVSNIMGTPKVLLVEDDETPLQSILTSSGLEVEKISSPQLPTTLSHYLQYQSIIFNNISGTDVTDNQMGLIEQAVKDFGSGFIMLGGEKSFGLGGYFKTPIENILPVEMEIKGKEELPSLGLMIVLDRSGSMDGQKLSMAKEAAARSVELLREEDTLGFIAFDDRPWVIIETGPIENKLKTIEKIRSISSGGGTEIYSSLKQAYEDLQNIDLQRKHIILLTDGDSATNGDYASLIEEGMEDNITLSTVAIGQDANRSLLEGLAQAGNGRFYNVTDATVIPSILSRETVMLTRTYIEDNPFYPTIYSIDGWDGLFQEGVPEMNAYIATTPKDTAKLPIVSEKDDPVVAEWQYGLGTTLAFTSDVTGKWTGSFAAWEKWPQFLNHLVSRSFQKYGSQPMALDIDTSGSEAAITLSGNKNQLYTLETSIISETGKKVDANLQLIAPGEYQMKVPNQPGLYFLNAIKTLEDGTIHTFQSGFSIPYSNEYLLKGTNTELLQQLSEETGGLVVENAGGEFRPMATKSFSRTPLSQWALLAGFIMLFIELVIRRLGLAYVTGYISKFFKKAKRDKEDLSTSADHLLKKQKHKRIRNNKNTYAQNDFNDEYNNYPTEHVPSQPEETKKPVQDKTNKLSKPPEKINDRDEQMKRLLQARKRKK